MTISIAFQKTETPPKASCEHEDNNELCDRTENETNTTLPAQPPVFENSHLSKCRSKHNGATCSARRHLRKQANE